MQLPCRGVRSYPPAIFGWAIADSEADDSSVPITTDRRIQIDFEGTLHFANVEMVSYYYCIVLLLICEKMRYITQKIDFMQKI